MTDILATKEWNRNHSVENRRNEKDVWHIDLRKSNRTDSWGRSLLPYTEVTGTHIFWTIFKQCDNLDLRLQSCLGFISRNPRYTELRRKVEARASKATDDVSYLNDMTIRQSSKGLNSNSFTTKHITKCLWVELKNKYKLSMVTIFSLEWNKPSRKFSRKR